MDMEAMAFAETETLASACRENTSAQTLEQLTEQICVFDTQSIVTFGSGAAAEVGRRATDHPWEPAQRPCPAAGIFGACYGRL